MSLAVLSYPALSADDFAWIQSIRREHDLLYFEVVNPHFTLVFPTDAVSEQVLLDHVRGHIRESAAFEIVMRCAILGDPDFQDHAHAFLMPDEGFSDVVRLHDRLYTGPLAAELRLDLPFLPHLAIANAPTPRGCKAIVDRINAEPFEIRGRIDSVDVIRYEEDRTWTIEQFSLS